ncbi:MAG TPA: hypothetical protein VMG60_09150 [Burkholderiaceae bacterium]|nr:hypothetical protein [Burkholderiaceae bacterium]
MTLLAEPRWIAATQALVEGCIDLPTEEDRVALLAAVCEGLGDDLYPAFLRVLTLIGQHGDYPARAAVASAVVHALRTGRLPTGRRSAWGASAQADAAFGSRRSLGPIEYLCAWHAQAEAAEALSADQFCAAASAVMELIAASKEARLLYCEKLLADVNDPLGGALTRQTREALRSLATAWSEGAAAADAAARFVSALSAASTRPLASLIGQAAYAAR